jgi:hypothetical protein
MAIFMNLTPHVINLNDGRSFAPCACTARVTSTHTEFVDDVCEVKFGVCEGLPPQTDGVVYIVSAIVAAAARRSDLVSPATGHPACVRENGQIKSVPGFVRAV